MNFTFHTAGEIIFGAGKFDELGSIARRFGQRVLLCIRGSHLQEHGILSKSTGSLADMQIEFSLFSLPEGEPTVQDVELGAAQVRKENPELIISIGGGSTIDTGKALAALASNAGSVEDYLEGAGRNLPISHLPLPHVAIPTTAGTGAEVTKNAVITSEENKVKRSMRSPLLLPNVALLDPNLTLSLPARITAETGMDALTQLIESYVSLKAQPIPSALAIDGIRLVGRHLRTAVQDGSNLPAREGMMLAALLSGIALANSGLGAAHGIAAALGGIGNIPHGRACAMLLPLVMRFNLPACTERFAQIAEALTGEHEADQKKAAEKAVTFVEQLCRDIGISRKFTEEGIEERDIPALVSGSFGSSMRGNPIPLSKEQVEQIIRELL